MRVPLLSPRWSRCLAEGLSVSAVRRHLENEQLQILLEADKEVTLEEF